MLTIPEEQRISWT